MKESNSDISGLCIYYNFISNGKYDLTDINNTDFAKKVKLFKNRKIYFYGIPNITTTSVTLKLAKAAEIFLLFKNILNQINENESNIKTLRANKKSYPSDKTLEAALELEFEQKSKLKEAFTKAVINMLKKYF